MATQCAPDPRKAVSDDVCYDSNFIFFYIFLLLFLREAREEGGREGEGEVEGEGDREKICNP